MSAAIEPRPSERFSEQEDPLQQKRRLPKAKMTGVGANLFSGSEKYQKENAAARTMQITARRG
jgi:hypothetical protein